MRWINAFVLLALATSCTANDDVPAPSVSGLSPTSVSPGAVITISGSYLCQQPGSDDDPLACASTGNVVFDAVPVAPLMWTDTSIMVEVPNLSMGEVAVSVTVAGRVSNSVALTVD